MYRLVNCHHKHFSKRTPMKFMYTHDNHFLSTSLTESLGPANLTRITLHFEVLVTFRSTETECPKLKQQIKEKKKKLLKLKCILLIDLYINISNYIPCCHYAQTSCHDPGSMGPSKSSNDRYA